MSVSAKNKVVKDWNVHAIQIIWFIAEQKLYGVKLRKPMGFDATSKWHPFFPLN